MRLLRIEDDGSFSLVEFFGSDIPEYAILSHTWGADHEEVTFRDLIDGTCYQKKSGYRKITLCGKQAAQDQLQYFWVDTCCIDKSSSAELSEAINSMFAWYRDSSICYVYLSDVMGIHVKKKLEICERERESKESPLADVEDEDNNEDRDSDQTDFVPKEREIVYSPGEWIKSRWFSRGWTLQELIAPQMVQFYSKEWIMLGTKADQCQSVSQTTNIPEHILRGGSLYSCSVAQRMSWASRRVTKREEDRAYCLLGIFDINMPLIYGEGKKSFFRLQQAILNQEEDYSILAWSCAGDSGETYRTASLTGLLASSPAAFSSMEIKTFRTDMALENCRTASDLSYTYNDSFQSYVPSRAGSARSEKLPRCLAVKAPRQPVRATSRGLHISLPVRTTVHSGIPPIAWTYCLCQGRLLCILLVQTNNFNVFARCSPEWLVTVDAKYLKEFQMEEIYCHATGQVNRSGGITGSLHPFHLTLVDLGRSEEAAERDKTQKGSSGVTNIDKMNKIQLLVSELRHIDPNNIVISDRIDTNWLDRVQIYIEDRTESPWNWAPLSPPRRPCTDDLWHLEWRCICGEQKWELAPRTFAQGVQKLISPTKDKHLLNHSSDPLTKPKTQPTSYVYLFVKSGKSLRSSQIALDGPISANLIDDFRKEYFKNRGVLRTLFSVWRFSHCKVVLALKTGQYIHILDEQQEEILYLNDPHEYISSSIREINLITFDELPIAFYSRTLFTRRDRYTLSQKHRLMSILLSLPKSSFPLNGSSTSVEKLSGLYAREIISLTGVICYALVICIVQYPITIFVGKEVYYSAVALLPFLLLLSLIVFVLRELKA